MPKTVATEWFLRLFTTPDRAAAIAGDMSEEGHVSWFDTLRTAAALFFRQAASQPFRLAFLILMGAVLSDVGRRLVIMPFEHRSYGPSIPWWLQTYVIVATRVLIPALLGYLMVRLAKGRDLTVCLGYGIVQTLFTLIGILVGMARWTPPSYGSWLFVSFLLWRKLIPAISLLVSGVLARRRVLNRELSQAR